MSGTDHRTDDPRDDAAFLMAPLVGREVSRVLIDFQVTLQFANEAPMLEVGFGMPFLLNAQGETELDVDPEHHGEDAAAIVGLFPRTVVAVSIDADTGLHLELSGDVSITAPAWHEYESWSFSSANGDVVHCLPSGGLSYWRAKRPDGSEDWPATR